MELDYVNIFLTLPNPLNIYETTTTTAIPNAAGITTPPTIVTSPNSPTTSTSESINSDSTNSMENRSASTIDFDDGNSSEAELTNLAWLTEIKNIGNLPLEDTTPNNNPTIRFNKFMTEIKRSKDAFEKKSHAYRSNPHEKPPFNYAHIIGMAMMDREMMTLKDICNWIKDNFAYYKYVGNWNNSIRHNLSLSVFFTKVARDKNEKGKGGYWKLAMDHTKTEKKRVRRNKNSNNNNNNNHSNNNNNISSNKISKLNNSVKMPKNELKCVNNNLNGNDAAAADILLSSPSNIDSINNSNILIDECTNSTTTILHHQGDDDSGGGGGGGGCDGCDNSECINLNEIEIIQSCNEIGVDINGDGNYVFNMDVCLNDGTHETYYDNIVTTTTTTSTSSNDLELDSLSHEIYLESDIPQPIDEIALPFVFNLPQNGPNVITESIPQYTNLPGLDAIDNSDFSSIKFNEYDELDTFLNSNQDFI